MNKVCKWCGEPLPDPEWTYCSTACADAYNPPKWRPRVRGLALTPFDEEVRVIGVYLGGLNEDSFVEVEYLEDGNFPKGSIGKYRYNDLRQIV